MVLAMAAMTGGGARPLSVPGPSGLGHSECGRLRRWPPHSCTRWRPLALMAMNGGGAGPLSAPRCPGRSLATMQVTMIGGGAGPLSDPLGHSLSLPLPPGISQGAETVQFGLLPCLLRFLLLPPPGRPTLAALVERRHADGQCLRGQLMELGRPPHDMALVFFQRMVTVYFFAPAIQIAPPVARIHIGAEPALRPLPCGPLCRFSRSIHDENIHAIKRKRNIREVSKIR